MDGRFVLVRKIDKRHVRWIVFYVVGAVESCEDLNHLQIGLKRKLLSADVDVVPPLDRGVQSHFHALDIRVEGRDGGVHDVDPGLRQNDVRKTGSDVDDAPVDVRRGLAVHVDAV